MSEEEKRLELLKKFGFTTNLADYKKSQLQEDYSSGKVKFLSLNDADARSLFMELMDGYPDRFKRGIDCSFCSKPIILPIDLRRHNGIDYHGYCFYNRIKEELKDATRIISTSERPKIDLSISPLVSDDVYDLEIILKIARVCMPRFGNTFDEALSEFWLTDVKRITTREQLEKWYWTGLKD